MIKKIISPDPVILTDEQIASVFAELWSAVQVNIQEDRTRWSDPREVTIQDGQAIFVSSENLPATPDIALRDPVLELLRLFGVTLYHLKVGDSELTSRTSYQLDGYYHPAPGHFWQLIHYLTALVKLGMDPQKIIARANRLAQFPLSQLGHLTPDAESKLSVTTTNGETFEVDTSDAACGRLGFLHSERVAFIKNHRFAGTVMGVTHETASQQPYHLLWIAFDQNNGRVSNTIIGRLELI